jgi:hypothetical protein
MKSRVLTPLEIDSIGLLARQEPSGRRRLRYIGLPHIKDGKSSTETAQALRATPLRANRRSLLRRLEYLYANP